MNRFITGTLLFILIYIGYLVFLVRSGFFVVFSYIVVDGDRYPIGHGLVDGIGVLVKPFDEVRVPRDVLSTEPTPVFNYSVPVIDSIVSRIGCDPDSLNKFVELNIPYRVSLNQTKPIETIIGGGNCVGKSILLVTLLRRCGYPSTVVYGYVVYRGTETITTLDGVTIVLDHLVPHAWVIYIDQSTGKHHVLDPTNTKGIRITRGYLTGYEEQTVVNMTAGKIIYRALYTESITATIIVYVLPIPVYYLLMNRSGNERRNGKTKNGKDTVKPTGEDNVLVKQETRTT